mmetsp:Transcript_21809/g.32476  ORF Transcript_21809/g.32476 Transcript_21809/m.32476 type:complete len:1249 (-) Transcript_21809:150-3896(-)|eukprot:CAMPEP_0167756230 /NCGR_PEP_ID=MMETSP0110_2-20121227/9269_1 /TAXON_ID=629695 /ORGANISM="Gymnochlora sp., Strain CCMP2014" /LENGTH=1248 /DNA_ID=CAMNT_0007642315 /DNA_START=98 /DNA_END=3844 /DNA_ORIENTATION=+
MSDEAKKQEEESSTNRLSGYLWKKHRKNKLWKGWHKRYFVLNGRHLSYYLHKKQADANSRPRGAVHLGRDSKVDHQKDGEAKRNNMFKFVVMIPPTGMMCLAGTSEEETEKWIAAIENVINQQGDTEGSIQQAEESGSDDDGKESVTKTLDSPSSVGDDKNISQIKFRVSQPKVRDTSDQKMGITITSPKEDNDVGTIKNATKHGILAKRGYFQGWHNRYFVLSGNKMSYYRMDLKNNAESVTNKTFRDSVNFNNLYTIQYKGRKDQGRKGELFVFSVIGPNCHWKLGTKTEAEAKSWVDAIKNTMISAPRTLERSRSALTKKDDIALSSADNSGTRRSRTPKGKRGHKRSLTGDKLRRYSFTRGTSPTPSSPVLRTFERKPQHQEGWLWKKYVRKKYWKGWHKRYFVLSGNYLQYFKDEKKNKALGSVILGRGCCIDRGSRIIARKTSLLQFTIFSDGPTTETPKEKEALLLAAQEESEVTLWVNTLEQAVHESKNFGVFENVGDNSEEEPEAIEELTVKYGDRIRLWTHTAYESKCDSGLIGVLAKESKEILYVPPIGTEVDESLCKEAIFTLAHPEWPRTVGTDKNELKNYGEDLKYGDSFLFVDNKSRIWSQESNYTCLRDRSSIKPKNEMLLSFHRIGCLRKGDVVRYGEHPIRIDAYANRKRMREVKNYKRGASKIVGGHLNCNGFGKPIYFTIQREDDSQYQSLPCQLDIALLNREINELERKHGTVSADTDVELGRLFGGRHQLRVTVKDLAGRTDQIVKYLEIPMLEPNAPKIDVISKSYNIKGDVFLKCKWKCEKWWRPKSMPEDENQSFRFETFMWKFFLCLGIYSCYKALMNGDAALSLSLIFLILAACPIIIQLRQTLLEDVSISSHPRKSEITILSSADWSVRISVLRLTTEAKPVYVDEGKSFQTKLEEKKAIDRKIEKKVVPKVLTGKILAGSSLQFVKPDSPVLNSYTTSHYNNFRVRAGPNYRKEKKKLPSKRELFDLVSVDILKTDRKVENFVPYLEFEPKTVDVLEARQIQIDKNRPDLKIPAIFSVQLTWPNYPPPNPLWGGGEGAGILFVLVFKANEWIDDRKNGTPAVTLISKLVNSKLNAKYRERFKVLPMLVNVDECTIGGFLKTIVKNFNGKPFLSRPEHKFCNGEILAKNSKGDSVKLPYHNITLDGYQFPFLARRTCYNLMDKSKTYIIDMGFIIEAREDDEMPEQVLGHVRFNYLTKDLLPEWNTPTENETEDKGSELD